MSSRSMSLDVLVRLRDNLSGGLNRLRGNLDRLASVGRKIGIVGGAIAAISFMGPVQEAAAFQQQLLDIAGTANLTHKAAYDYVDKAKKQYEELAIAVGQTSDIVAKGAGQMIAAGVDPKLIDASIGAIGKSATAANAEFSDMASVATSLLTTLKVPADQLEGSLAGLLVAGKEGAFEMKDMARYFPTLTGQMAKFGVTGREAVNFLGAALQIAKKGTADPAEAANNLKNFLSKALAPATVKNFKEAGIDIQAVMRDAATKGINPIEAVMQKVVKVTGVSGNEIEKMMAKAKKRGLEGAEALADVREQLQKIHGAGKLGEIFSDQQVMDFLIPFLSNVDEFKRIKEEVSKATGAMIDADFETQMAGMNRQLTMFGEIGTQAAREVGFAFGAWLPEINAVAMSALKWFRDLDASTGGLARKALSWAGGIVLLATAMGILGVALPIATAGFGAIFGLVGALLSPLGIVLGLLAGAGVLIWKNWDKVAPRLRKVWEGVSQGAQRAWDFITLSAGRVWPFVQRSWASALPYLTSLWGRVSSAAGRAFGSVNLAEIGASLRQRLGEFASGLTPALAGIGESLSSAFASLGETWTHLQRLGAAIGGLLGKLADLAGFDGGSVSRTLGKILGGFGLAAVQTIQALAWALSKIVKGLADLAEWANGGKVPDWIAWFPNTAVSLVTSLANSVGRLWSYLKEDIAIPFLDWSGISGNFQAIYETVSGWLNSLKALIQSVMNALGQIGGAYEAVKNKIAGLGDLAWGSSSGSGIADLGPARSVGEAIGRMGPKAPAANSNTPEQHSALPGRPGATQLAALQPRQSVNVGGTVRVQVEGPGKVAGVSSDSNQVPITADRGRMVGRA